MKKLTFLLTLLSFVSVAFADSEPKIQSSTINPTATGSISGRVSGLLNSSDLEVKLYNGSGQYVKMDYPSGGYYRFDGLSSGNYYVLGYSDDTEWGRRYEGLPTLYGNKLCIDEETPIYFCDNVLIGTKIVVSEGQAVENINITLIEGSSISGTVLNDAGESTSSTVNLYKRNSSGQYKLYFSDQYWYPENGEYIFNGVTPGSYKVKAKSHYYIDEIYNNIVCPSNSCQTTMGNAFLVPNFYTQVTGINFSLTPIASVTFNFDPLPADGTLQLVSVDSGEYYGSKHLSAGSTSVTKSFSSGLPRSARFLFLFDEDGPMFSKFWGGPNCLSINDCNPEDGNISYIQEGTYRTYNIQLDKKFELNLNINNINTNIGNDKPTISLYQNDQIISSHTHDSNPSIIYPTSTGDIKLKVDLDGYNSEIFENINCFENCDISQGSNINAQLNQSRTISMSLPARLQIRGRIYDSASEFLPNHRATLYRIDEDELTYVAQTYSNENGYYTFLGDLDTEAQYTVKGQGDSVHLDTYYGDIVCDESCAPEDYQAKEVTPNQTAVANIKLKAKGKISIDHLSYFNGGIANSIRVSLHPTESTQSISSQYTDDAGKITDWSVNRTRIKMSFRDNGVYSVYPDIICGNYLTQACLDSGATIHIPAAETVVITDAVLNQRGNIHVTTLHNGQPLANIKVQVIDEQGQTIRYAVSNDSGLAALNELNSGSYAILAQPQNGFQYKTTLYPDMACPGGLGIGCEYEDGQAITPVLNETVSLAIDMNQNPAVSINFNDEFTHESISQFDFQLYDSNSNYMAEYSLSANSEVQIPPGNYYALAYSNSHQAATWPNFKCHYSHINGCSELQLLTVDDISNQIIEIESIKKNGLYFEVIDGETNNPIEGAIVDIWQNQNAMERVTVDDMGRGVTNSYLFTGQDYQFSTDIGIDPFLMNEVFNNKQCIDGPVMDGHCDLTMGDVLNYVPNTIDAQIIRFELHGDPIFNHGFETQVNPLNSSRVKQE